MVCQRDSRHWKTDSMANGSLKLKIMANGSLKWWPIADQHAGQWLVKMTANGKSAQWPKAWNKEAKHLWDVLCLWQCNNDQRTDYYQKQLPKWYSWCTLPLSFQCFLIYLNNRHKIESHSEPFSLTSKGNGQVYYLWNTYKRINKWHDAFRTAWSDHTKVVTFLITMTTDLTSWSEGKWGLATACHFPDVHATEWLNHTGLVVAVHVTVAKFPWKEFFLHCTVLYSNTLFGSALYLLYFNVMCSSVSNGHVLGDSAKLIC